MKTKEQTEKQLMYEVAGQMVSGVTVTLDSIHAICHDPQQAEDIYDTFEQFRSTRIVYYGMNNEHEGLLLRKRYTIAHVKKEIDEYIRDKNMSWIKNKDLRQWISVLISIVAVLIALFK